MGTRQLIVMLLCFVWLILDTVQYGPHDIGVLWLDTDTQHVWWERPCSLYILRAQQSSESGLEEWRPWWRNQRILLVSPNLDHRVVIDARIREALQTWRITIDHASSIAKSPWPWTHYAWILVEDAGQPSWVPAARSITSVTVLHILPTLPEVEQWTQEIAQTHQLMEGT